MAETYMTLPQIQQRCLGMLHFFDQLCEKEHLTYWLSGGTLLGAVRHGGFIPWDDDVDLMMPRDDFERLLQVARRYNNATYTIHHPRLDTDFAMPWIRVWDLGTRVDLTNMVRLGAENLFIDVFPVDALPTAQWRSNLFFKRSRMRTILLKCSRKTDLWEEERLKLLKRALMVLTKVRTPNAYARFVDNLCKRGSLKKAKYAGVCVLDHYGNRERMPIEVFSDTVFLPFCDVEYPAPVGWEHYLTRLYGDYMQLPPEDQRQSDHNLKARLANDGEDA